VQRSQVFSTSQRLAPPKPVTALFHAAGTPGVFPFRAFPLLESVRLSTPAPLLTLPWLSSSTSHGKPWSISPSHFGRLQGVVPPASPFLRCRALTRITAAGALLGFLPSKGLPDLAMETPSRLLLSRTWALLWSSEEFLPFAPCLRVSLTRPVAGLPKETAVLPGVHSLVTPDASLKLASPWLIVSPQDPQCVTACRGPSSGVAPFDRGSASGTLRAR
jgi:hypothetical protein